MADPFLVQDIESGGTTPLNAEAAAIWEQALTQASAYLAELLTRADREALFAGVFGRAGTEATVFEANKQALLATIGGDGLQIAVDLRSNGELAGAFAAYAASGHTGLERIYVNADKLNNGLLDVNLATSALLEEFGHALDRRLNGGVDSPGDEGQLFAAEVTGVVLTAEQRAAIDAEDDTATLTIEGVEVLVELANGTAGTTGTAGTNGTSAPSTSNATAGGTGGTGNPGTLGGTGGVGGTGGRGGQGRTTTSYPPDGAAGGAGGLGGAGGTGVSGTLGSVGTAGQVVDSSQTLSGTEIIGGQGGTGGTGGAGGAGGKGGTGGVGGKGGDVGGTAESAQSGDGGRGGSGGRGGNGGTGGVGGVGGSGGAGISVVSNAQLTLSQSATITGGAGGNGGTG
jgi:hypothetical protein